MGGGVTHHTWHRPGSGAGARATVTRGQGRWQVAGGTTWPAGAINQPAGRLFKRGRTRPVHNKPTACCLADLARRALSAELRLVSHRGKFSGYIKGLCGSIPRGCLGKGVKRQGSHPERALGPSQRTICVCSSTRCATRSPCSPFNKICPGVVSERQKKYSG